MKKTITLLSFLAISIAAYSQLNTAKVIKDTSYLYTDTINKKIYFGNYEPTGLIKAPDGGCIVSTTFGIYFPISFDMALLKANPKKYVDSTRQFTSREHVSSGSIFKLNKQYQKDWEIVFDEKRVKQIVPYDDTTFIATGERTDQKNIWVARINSTSGKAIWFKEFVNKRNPGLQGIAISTNKQIIVLSESQRLIPLRISKQYGRIRFVFFEEPENLARKVALLNISGEGSLNWERNLGISKKWEMFDEFISADSIISIVSTYSSSEKKYVKNGREFGDLNFAYDLNGNKLVKHEDKRNGLCLADINGWLYFSKMSSDTLKLTKYDARMSKMLDRMIITPQHYTSLKNIVLINNYYYMFGAIDVKKVMICKLDTAFNMVNSMIYQTHEMITDTKLGMSPNGHIMVTGKVFKDEVPNSNKPYQYINLIEFDLK